MVRFQGQGQFYHILLQYIFSLIIACCVSVHFEAKYTCFTSDSLYLLLGKSYVSSNLQACERWNQSYNCESHDFMDTSPSFHDFCIDLWMTRATFFISQEVNPDFNEPFSRFCAPFLLADFVRQATPVMATAMENVSVVTSCILVAIATCMCLLLAMLFTKRNAMYMYVSFSL